MTPKITVVLPVYNRSSELRRALLSVQNQTYDDFECIVVDDASTIPIQPVVASLNDGRFKYQRQPSNSGPYSARIAAFRLMQGKFAIGLDSDDEAYPWMLSRAVKYLDDTPDVDGVAGMYVGMSDGRMRVRIEGGSKIMSPSEYVVQPPIPDCAGAVRKCVVDEWLRKRDDYFALEFHQWFTFHMHHNQLFVDEPWAKTYIANPDRVSQRMESRQLDDYIKFLDEHQDYIDGTRAAVLDNIVADAWFQLTRAGRKADAARFAPLLETRGLKKSHIIATRVLRKTRRFLQHPDSLPPYHLR
jgi:glycosyltransferase involved in cell wall biosynthesis